MVHARRFRNVKQNQQEMQTKFDLGGKMIIQLTLASFINATTKGQATIDCWLPIALRYGENEIALWREYWRQSLS